MTIVENKMLAETERKKKPDLVFPKNGGFKNMKNQFALALVGSLVCASAYSAQNGAMSIGSGDGSLSIGAVYTDGFIDGDDATFNPGGGVSANTTIWNHNFCIYDVAGATDYWSTDTGFTNHTTHPTDGTEVLSATQLSHTGMTFSGNASLGADLQIDLSAPSAGNTVEMSFAWTFSNSSGSPIELRLFHFVDGDVYVGGSAFNDDIVAFIPATESVSGYTMRNTKGVAAIGDSDGGSGVDLNRGILVDWDTEPTYYYGISSDNGSSFWWSASSEYSGTGIEATSFDFDGAIQDVVQNDVDSNGVADSGKDAGIGTQFNLTVPASGNVSITAYLTWGVDATFDGPVPSDVSEWELYQ